MPAFMALATGVVNAVALITATAMPFALAEIAAFVALTICGTFEVDDPVQRRLGNAEQRRGVLRTRTGWARRTGWW